MWGLRLARVPWISPRLGSSPRTWGLRIHGYQQHFLFCGSSPRTWGLLLAQRPHVIRIRFIPTHVGFTVGHSALYLFLAVHPHSRGVYHYARYSASVRRGSSPRTWGLRFHKLHKHWIIRFIPTHVGFTPWRLSQSRAIFGSSPRTWGLRIAKKHSQGYRRFIPTHVGFTLVLHVLRRLPVHPHARGVYSVDAIDRAGNSGSSPRTWGLLLQMGDPFAQQRFIPTHVGFTGTVSTGRGNTPVHPHARGVYVLRQLSVFQYSGSSPRTWGLR